MSSKAYLQKPSCPLNLAIVGYGKMGKMVEKSALLRGHQIQKIIPSKTTPTDFSNCDVAIDFTSPHATLQIVHQAGSQGKNLVIGTTGWQEQHNEIQALAHQYHIGILHSPNFSIGVYLFLKLIENACRLFAPTHLYDIAGSEQHHHQKQDAPSGTAKAMTEKILKNWPNKTSASFELPSHAIAKEVFHFSTLRVGHIPGTHTLYLDSPQDTITLNHSAKGREGFADGAVMAAEWLHGKKGFYTLEDVLK